MRLARSAEGKTKRGRIRNERIRENLKINTVNNKLINKRIK
jgi:hypothetical protein